MAPKRNLSIKIEAKKHAYALQKLKIKKKEEPLLEIKIKEVEAKLKSFGASQKDVHKINSEGIQNFFQKACRW